MAVRRLRLVAFDGAQLLDIVGPAEVFDAASRLCQTDDRYEVLVATPGGTDVRSLAGLRLRADAALEDPQLPLDTLLVGGALDPGPPSRDRALVEGVSRHAAAARRIASVCSGAAVLAAAGLLDGRTATTHWAAAGWLARHHPAVHVEPDRIFVRDGRVITSAGVTAGIDLALALVEEDHGPELARAVARWLVVVLQRPGGQSQFSERTRLPAVLSDPLRHALDLVAAAPREDHRLEALAPRVAVSPRHLTRLFAEQAHTTPARYVERVRVEAARSLLETSTASLGAVAEQAGFTSAETLRRAFLRVAGITPGQHRARFSTTTRPEELIA